MNTEALICPITHKRFGAIQNNRICTTDGAISYPIKDDVPILMGPEAVTEIAPWPRDVTTPQYDEAYTEMEFYNAVGYQQASEIREHGTASSKIPDLRQLGFLAALSPEERGPFPESENWYCETIEAGAEMDCFRYIGPVTDKRIIQIGGMGMGAILFLLTGAAEAYLLTPMHGEAAVAKALAELFGLKDRLHCIVGVAEEAPLIDDYFDVCYVGSCVHHMRTEFAFAEISRILRSGGKFAAIEPWRTPLYSIGIKLFGKREPDVHCRPMTKERVAPMYGAFSSARYVQHGALTRYPAIVAQKAGLFLSARTSRQLTALDDAICSFIPFGRKMGSGVALLATK